MHENDFLMLKYLMIPRFMLNLIHEASTTRYRPNQLSADFSSALLSTAIACERLYPSVNQSIGSLQHLYFAHYAVQYDFCSACAIGDAG